MAPIPLSSLCLMNVNLKVDRNGQDAFHQHLSTEELNDTLHVLVLLNEQVVLTVHVYHGQIHHCSWDESTLSVPQMLLCPTAQAC
jgi:hypothetical protein